MLTIRAVLLWLALAAAANAAEPVPVFVLHSYSQEYPWTLGQHRGFMDTLNADKARSYDVRAEYLDTKRTRYTPAYGDLIAGQLREKYRGYRPAAVYVTDDNALSFALAHLKEIFPGVPVFFSGINDYDVKPRLDPARVTGVFEKKEIGPNLDLMRTLAPDNHDIVVVGDASETYHAIESAVRAELARQTAIRATFVSAARIEDLTDRLRKQKARFVFLTTLGDVASAEGRKLTLPEAIGAIVAAGDFVVFSMEDAYLYPGVLGGYVTSGPRQGAVAAGMLRRHLDGAPLAALAPVEASPNEYIVDDVELGRAQLTLPPDVARQATHINVQPTFYESNRTLVLGALYGLISLVVLGLIATVLGYARKNREIHAVTENLRHSETRYRLIVESAAEGFWMIDADRRTVFVNEALCRILGYAPEEMIGRHPTEFADEVNQNIFRAQMARIEQSLHRHYEIELRRKDGRNIPLYFQATTHFDAAGKPLLAFAFVTDLTERKAMERELRDSEARANQIVENAPDAMLIVGADGRILSLNERTKTLFGYAPAELVGQPVEILVPDDLRMQHRSEREQYNRRRHSRPMDKRPDLVARRKDGSHFPVSINLATLPAGEERQTIVSIVDMSAYQAMEAELRTHRDRLEELVAERTASLARAEAIAHVGSWHVDIADDRHVWSDETYRIFALPPDTPLTTQLFFDHVYGDDADRVAAAWNAAIAGADYDIEHRIVAAGEIKWVRQRAELVCDKDGKTVAAHGAVQDITERKTAEEAIVAALEQTRRLALAKSEFLANMSHEIRTPLNAVLGFARIGVRDSAGRASQESFVRIQNAGEHLLGIINDILDFSKIEAGKLAIEDRPFPLAAVIANAVSFVADAARQKALVYEAEAAANLPEWVRGDPQRLQQILVNLLSNAVKFTDRGEVRLHVAPEGENICFKVIDSGIGLSAEQMGRLFKPFEQADSSTTRKFGGTGLGLAISRNLANLMAGEITVQSAPGAGSTFTLRLPLQAAEQDIPHHAGPAVPAAARLSGVRVLAAEDVEFNRIILEDLLVHEGARVVFAEHGQQALERIEEAGASTFDVVLMDIQMPVMDGYEATRRIREIAPALPVIGLTAHALAEERDNTRAAGMVDHLTKPIDPEALVAAVLQCTRRSGFTPTA